MKKFWYLPSIAVRCCVAIAVAFFCTLGVVHFFFPRHVPNQPAIQNEIALSTPVNPIADPSSHAAKLANDECEYFFKARPFVPESFELRFSNGRYEWGRLDPAGVNGYSATVSFASDGGDARVSVYFSVDTTPIFDSIGYVE